MRKIIFICALILPFIGTYANAQQASKTNALPQDISKIFQEQYPSASFINCKKQNDRYVVRFRSERKKHKAYYGLTGNWIKTTTNISFTRSLPQNIDDGWKESGYQAWYIKYMTEIQKPDSSYYVFDVDNSSLLDADHIPVSLQEENIYFDTNGNLIKKLKVE